MSPEQLLEHNLINITQFEFMQQIEENEMRLQQKSRGVFRKKLIIESFNVICQDPRKMEAN